MAADGAGAAGAAGVEAGALAGVDGAWEEAAEEGAVLGCRSHKSQSSIQQPETEKELKEWLP